MSSIVPVLSRERARELIEWMRQRCCSQSFDPMDPEFQAAISLLAASDRAQQARILGIEPASNVAMPVKNVLHPSDIPSLAQILMYRSIQRHIPIPPSTQRVAMQTIDPAEIERVPETSEIDLAFLTGHVDDDPELLPATPGDHFRSEFTTGEGQPPSFLIDRRIAVLTAASSTQTLTPDYKQIVLHEIRKLKVSQQQAALRDRLMRFDLDPLGASLPDYHKHLMAHNDVMPRLSPQHVGLLREYDISAAMDTSQTSVHLRQILGQATRFLNELSQRVEQKRAISGALEKYKKDKERERNRAKKAEEKIRWDLLKQKDMPKYRETVKKMKDQRIQELLTQTDKYMAELRERIKLNQATSSITEEAEMGKKYQWELKLPENVRQPDHLTGTLKDYQVKGLQWLVGLYQAKMNGILADEMGLGKTIQTIALLAWLFEKCNDFGPHLICAPLSTLSNWEAEFREWFPQFLVVKYNGTPSERKEVEKKYIASGSHVNAILTTYEFVVRDRSVLSKLDYSYLIIDEAHKLKNHQGKLSQTLSHYYRSKNRLLLTGTPLQNTPRELWSLLNFILPTIFDDHNKFDEWFAAPFAKAGEAAKLTQEETWVVLTQLHDVLRPFMFRRLKEDVADQLPDKKEATILCPMSAWQHSMYITMEDHSVIVHPDLSITRMDNKQIQCRKICNHPYLFQDTYYVNAGLIRTCGKFELLDRILPKFYKTHHRVLIFSQMTELLDLLEDLLKFRDYKYLRLDGNTKSEFRPQLTEAFNAPNSEYFIFMLSTRAGGLGLNLQTADTVIIYDSDWNPFADMQASARVHRIGQDKEVLVISLSTPDTVERKVQRVQDEKRIVEDMIISAAIFNDESNVDDRKAVYQAVTAKNQSGGVTNVPNDAQINKIIARTPEELELFEQMDQERDARYQREWELEGHTGEYPRLVTYEELPDYLKVPVEDLIKEEELPDFRRSRSKNRLSMIDTITDSDDTHFIEDGRDTDDHRSDSEDTRSACRKLINKATKILGINFDTLPTREELPRYYEIIQHPITFLEIKDRAARGDYASVDQLRRDLRLMAKNAMTFNGPDTPWYNDAAQLLTLIDGKPPTPHPSSDIPDDSSLY